MQRSNPWALEYRSLYAATVRHEGGGSTVSSGTSDTYETTGEFLTLDSIASMKSADRIGVSIGNLNRHRLFYDTLNHWIEHTPPEVPIVVVDDASDPPLEVPERVTLIRNDYRLGIAMTKNRGIAALMDAGVEHLFLADSDVYPLTDDWWQPYMNSPEPSLSYQWAKPGRTSRWKIEHDDCQHFSISFPRGVMLYATRKVIDTVGGMDPAHGAWGGEHCEWQHRIHQAGLTTWEFADVCVSHKIWYSYDRERGNTVGSSFPLSDRRKMAKRNGVQWDKERATGLYVPYREGEGVQDYSLGPSLGDEPLDTLEHVLGLHPTGTAVEFGVGSGRTLKMIAEKMPAIGADSFAGLPADWRPNFPRGTFACEPPQIDNATIVTGLFEDTLPDFDWDSLGYIGLVHLDADLYSSTKTVLEHVGPHLKPGSYVVMDEYHSWPGWENDGECRAWKEWADQTGVGWTCIGHGVEQLAVRIL